MPVKELLVIIVGLVAGYLIVNAVLSPGVKPRQPQPGDDNAGGARGSGSGSSGTAGATGGAGAAAPGTSSAGGDVAVTLSNWYRILGVREKATREEIATAYKKLVSQYHPDKVTQMGPDIRAVAEAKTKQINAAYDLAMRIYR